MIKMKIIITITSGGEEGKDDTELPLKGVNFKNDFPVEGEHECIDPLPTSKDFLGKTKGGDFPISIWIGTGRRDVSAS